MVEDVRLRPPRPSASVPREAWTLRILTEHAGAPRDEVRLRARVPLIFSHDRAPPAVRAAAAFVRVYYVISGP